MIGGVDADTPYYQCQLILHLLALNTASELGEQFERVSATQPAFSDLYRTYQLQKVHQPPPPNARTGLRYHRLYQQSYYLTRSNTTLRARRVVGDHKRRLRPLIKCV